MEIYLAGVAGGGGGASTEQKIIEELGCNSRLISYDKSMRGQLEGYFEYREGVECKSTSPVAHKDGTSL